MKLRIDNHETEALPGQRLKDLVAALELDGTQLSTRPIAAKIAGEVYTLNYVPVRDEKEVRRAMAASDSCVNLVYYNDPAGKDVYERTAYFVLFLAIDRLWPNARTNMTASLGPGVYVEVREAPDFSALRLKEEMRKIVAEDMLIVRRRVRTADAMAYFREHGNSDKAELLKWWPEETFDEYVCGDFHDHYFGEMAPSTGYVNVWDIRPAEDGSGFLFLLPDDADPNKVGTYQHMPHFFSVFTEGERWCELMECETVADLNQYVRSGNIRKLIRVNEALHEKRFSQVADMICEQGGKIVMLAGPSSSGKTTSANRLATQLQVHGKKPVLMSLDDYYIDRDLMKPGPDGKIDFEHIDTIDTDLFREHIGALVRGEEVEIPAFDFKTGKRVWHGHMLKMQPNSVIIVEGLHALNPVLRPDGVDDRSIFKLYVSPLIPLGMDHHTRIPTNFLRLLRRVVRDYKTRGATVQRTLSMWDSVRQGEKRWIYPFQESADVIFNSSTLYELAVLKRYIFDLLSEVTPDDPWYEEVLRITKMLSFIREADVEDEIPPTSLVREFIGGNTFYRK